LVTRVPSKSAGVGSIVLETPSLRRYNIAMPASGAKRQPDAHSPEHHHTPQIYTLEATGLLLIAGLILILTLVRYWHHIAWSAR